MEAFMKKQLVLFLGGVLGAAGLLVLHPGVSRAKDCPPNIIGNSFRDRYSMSSLPCGYNGGGGGEIQGIGGTGTANYLAKFLDPTNLTVSILYDNGSNVGIGTTLPSQKLEVNGTIYSSSGGFKFPDGTLQTTASSGGGSSYWSANGTNIYNTNTGNVGIGTSSPAQKLHVEGGDLLVQTTASDTRLSLYNNSAGGRHYAISSTGNASAVGGGKLNFHDEAAGSRMVIDSSGKVGIGTTLPSQKLSVVGTIESTSGGFKFPDGTMQSTAAFGGSNLWATSGTDIYNTNAGSVGIGVAVPQSRLDIGGKLRLYDTSPPGSSADAGYAFATGAIPSALVTELSGSVLTLGMNVAQVGTRDAAKVGGIARIDSRDFPAGTAEGSKSFIVIGQPVNGTETGRFAVNLQTGEVLMAYNGGNVGIGTTGPSQKLDVDGNLRVRSLASCNTVDTDASGNLACGTDETSSGVGGSGTTNYLAKFSGATSIGNSLVYDNGTNVGIGTTSPSQKLSVEGGHFYITNSASDTGLFVVNTSTGGRRYIISSTGNASSVGGGKLNFHDEIASASRMVIDSSGNVGVGTTSPVRKLDVNGDGLSVGFTSPLGQTRIILGNRNSAAIPGIVASENGNLRFGKGSSFSSADGGTLTEAMIVNSDGKVGVNTSTPQSTLQVANGYMQIPFLPNTSGPNSADCDSDSEGGRMVVTNDGPPFNTTYLWVCGGAAGWHGS